MKVIARHNEDIEVKDGDFVVQKGVHLENKGREASSYLWYIVLNYDTLEGLYEFRQAKEHDHRVHSFICECNLNGGPHHPGLPIKHISELINLEVPEVLTFTAGAQFNVTAEQIKARNKDWYIKALEVSMSESEAPWIFERLWKYIFNIN